MKTPEEWAMLFRDRIPFGASEQSYVHQFAAAIQADAFTAGERKGRMDGLREAQLAICDHGDMARVIIGNGIKALEREQIK